MYKIKLEQFEGPLDLLLQLIETQELDISTIALAEVTASYLEYLGQTHDLAPEEVADFLVVAAKLLLIKSRTLLPELAIGETGDEGSLEQQLRIYKEFLDASKVIHRMLHRKQFSFVRETHRRILIEPVFCPPKHLTTSDLKLFFLAVLKEIEPIVTLPQSVIRKTISIAEKIKQIEGLIERERELSFQGLMRQSRSKTEIVVTFLALLELVKQRAVIVFQNNIFEDITIKRNHVD